MRRLSEYFFKRYPCSIILIFLLCGCQKSVNKTPEPLANPATDNMAASSSAENFLLCPEQRPEMCTMDYLPVCAERDTGVRCVKEPCKEAKENATYSNGCSACSDLKVSGYRPGSCSEE